jgi:hypothetical protein
MAPSTSQLITGRQKLYYSQLTGDGSNVTDHSSTVNSVMTNGRKGLAKFTSLDFPRIVVFSKTKTKHTDLSFSLRFLHRAVQELLAGRLEHCRYIAEIRDG